MNNEKYISPTLVSKQFGVTSGALRRWAEAGKIRYLRPNTTSERGGRRIYNVEDIKKIFGIKEDQGEARKTVCYARVSSSHQKDDLERQILLLKGEYPEAEIIRDIGSGLNWNRPGFRSILERVSNGDIKEIVVTYRDRVCRFGYELVEWIFKKSNAKIVVLNSNPDAQDISRELSDDLLAITTVFVAKNNGLRAASYRRARKEKEGKADTKETEEACEARIE